MVHSICNRNNGNGGITDKQLICLNNLGMEPTLQSGIFDACGTLVFDDVSCSVHSIMYLPCMHDLQISDFCANEICIEHNYIRT